MQLAILLGVGEIAAGPDTLVQPSVSALLRRQLEVVR